MPSMISSMSMKRENSVTIPFMVGGVSASRTCKCNQIIFKKNANGSFERASYITPREVRHRRHLARERH